MGSPLLCPVQLHVPPSLQLLENQGARAVGDVWLGRGLPLWGFRGRQLAEQGTLLPPASTVAPSRLRELRARRGGLLCMWPSLSRHRQRPPGSRRGRGLGQALLGISELASLSPRLPFPALLTKTQSEPFLSYRGTVSRSAWPTRLHVAWLWAQTRH